MNFPYITIIGGGLAGTEAAWQAAQLGLHVSLFEMRPGVGTGAHETSNLAELVCSNSLGSVLPDRASGLLKTELEDLNSLLMQCARISALPAGSALAVDRNVFSNLVTERILAHPNIEVIHEEVTEIPDGPTIIASGPLTSEGLSKAIVSLTGENQLFFFDALAPIIAAESINMDIAFHASRYDQGSTDQGDYINCPLTHNQYDLFVKALQTANRITLRDFEREMEQGVVAGLDKYFEGCLPVEIIAARGIKALAFGPMRPTGLTDPRTGRWPYATVQLRQDNLAASLYNLVGFQTNLTFTEQKRIFKMVPGLENADFVRFGQMHRNTFISSPNLLSPTLQYRYRQDLFFAGQITGVEGYVGNIATGLLAGRNISNFVMGEELIILPETTMLGALCNYITHAEGRNFQPMKANFGIMPALATSERMDKRTRAKLFVDRARYDFKNFTREIKILS